ncbi:hypothetical protein BH11ACT2_BH11ACT2_18370 [soil metagenome]
MTTGGVATGVEVGDGGRVAEKFGRGLADVGGRRITVGFAFEGVGFVCVGVGVLDVTGAPTDPRSIRVPSSSPTPASRMTRALTTTITTGPRRRRPVAVDIGIPLPAGDAPAGVVASGSVSAGSGRVGGSCSPMGSVGSSLMRPSLGSAARRRENVRKLSLPGSRCRRSPYWDA